MWGMWPSAMALMMALAWSVGDMAVLMATTSADITSPSILARCFLSASRLALCGCFRHGLLLNLNPVTLMLRRGLFRCLPVCCGFLRGNAGVFLGLLISGNPILLGLCRARFRLSSFAFDFRLTSGGLFGIALCLGLGCFFLPLYPLAFIFLLLLLGPYTGGFLLGCLARLFLGS